MVIGSRRGGGERQGRRGGPRRRRRRRRGGAAATRRLLPDGRYQWPAPAACRRCTSRAAATMRAASTSIGALQHRRERMRGRLGVQPAHGRVELVEGQLVDRLADLAADAAHRPGFVDDQQRGGSCATLATMVSTSSGMIVRKVDDFARDALRRQRLGRFQRAMHHLAGRDDGEVGARRARCGRRRTARSARPPAPAPFDANSALGSSMITGSPARSAVFISPLASAGFDGTQTISPGNAPRSDGSCRCGAARRCAPRRRRRARPSARSSAPLLM